MTFPVSIEVFSSDFICSTIVIEINTKKTLTLVEQYFLTLSSYQKKQLEAAIGTGKEKIFTFYPEKVAKKLICFFPDSKKSLSDERSKFLGEYTGNIAYFPDKEVSSAFEIFVLTSYRFTCYKSKCDIYQRIFLVQTSQEKEQQTKEIPLLQAVLRTRDIVNMPSQDMYPQTFVDRILNKKWKNFDVQVFSTAELKKMGCNLICAVGKGSTKESFMVVFVPKKPPKTKKYALVGKGVTFDAGGIQIKGGKDMLDMKCDMAGGATVLGVAEYFDTLDVLPVHITLAIGLAENMTGGDAYKPLDVYRAYNGTMVEIVHTDAEGRLILADVVAYVEKQYNIDHIITIATLTGACIYALGYDMAGIIGNDEEVIEKMISMQVSYESVWRLPLNQRIQDFLKSDIADIKNLNSEEYTGASIGAAFLTYFQGNAKLTHLDIAGPSFLYRVYGPIMKGGTGWGVRFLSLFFHSI